MKGQALVQITNLDYGDSFEGAQEPYYAGCSTWTNKNLIEIVRPNMLTEYTEKWVFLSDSYIIKSALLLRYRVEGNLQEE